MPRIISIFEDQDLLSNIEKLFEKKAQDAGVVANYGLALRALDALSKQDTSPTIRPAEPEEVETNQPSESDLYSLDAFINYLAKFLHKPAGNLVAKGIVLPLEENEPMQGYVKYVSKNPAGTFQVNKNGIVDALNFFAKKAAESQNLYLQELISKLLEDAKLDKQLNIGDNLSVKPEENKDIDFTDLSDPMKLDQISSRVNLKQELYPDRAGVITVGDLRDDTIENFVKRFSVSIDGSDNYIALDFNAENSAQNPICAFFNYLHERARKIISTMAAGDLVSKYYLVQVERFMGEKHCPVGVAITQPQAQKTDEKWYPQKLAPGQYEQAVYEQVSQSLQQDSGSETFIMPFNLGTNIISFDRFKNFVNQVDVVLKNEVFVKSIQYDANTLQELVSSTRQAIAEWESVSSGSRAKEGGFVLNVSQDVRSLVQNLGAGAQNPYGKARDMLYALVPVVVNLSNIVRVLGGSRIVKQMIGDDILRQQYQSGLDYRDVINSLLSQINTMFGRQS